MGLKGIETVAKGYAVIISTGKPATGKTVTATISKNGATPSVACTNTPYEIGEGLYGVVLTAAEVNFDNWAVIWECVDVDVAIYPQLVETYETPDGGVFKSITERTITHGTETGVFGNTSEKNGTTWKVTYDGGLEANVKYLTVPANGEAEKKAKELILYINYYCGTSDRELTIKVYNYDTSSYDTLETISSTGGLFYPMTKLALSDDYTAGNGKIELAFVGTGAVAADYFEIDYTKVVYYDVGPIKVPTVIEIAEIVKDILHYHNGATSWLTGHQSLGSDGSVWLDVNAPEPYIGVHERGTPMNPCTTLTEALVLADSLLLKRIHLVGDTEIEIPNGFTSLQGYFFIGDSRNITKMNFVDGNLNLIKNNTFENIDFRGGAFFENTSSEKVCFHSCNFDEVTWNGDDFEFKNCVIRKATFAPVVTGTTYYTSRIINLEPFADADGDFIFNVGHNVHCDIESKNGADIVKKFDAGVGNASFVHLNTSGRVNISRDGSYVNTNVLNLHVSGNPLIKKELTDEIADTEVVIVRDSGNHELSGLIGYNGGGTIYYGKKSSDHNFTTQSSLRLGNLINPCETWTEIKTIAGVVSCNCCLYENKKIEMIKGLADQNNTITITEDLDGWEFIGDGQTLIDIYSAPTTYYKLTNCVFKNCNINRISMSKLSDTVLFENCRIVEFKGSGVDVKLVNCTVEYYNLGEDSHTSAHRISIEHGRTSLGTLPQSNLKLSSECLVSFSGYNGNLTFIGSSHKDSDIHMEGTGRITLSNIYSYEGDLLLYGSMRITNETENDNLTIHSLGIYGRLGHTGEILSSGSSLDKNAKDIYAKVFETPSGGEVILKKDQQNYDVVNQGISEVELPASGQNLLTYLEYAILRIFSNQDIVKETIAANERNATVKILDPVTENEIVTMTIAAKEGDTKTTEIRINLPA